MGKPRRPRGSRPVGTPQPFQAAPAPAEIRAAEAPIAVREAAPRAESPAEFPAEPSEAAEPRAEAIQAVVEATAPVAPDVIAQVTSEVTSEAASDTGAAADIARPTVPAPIPETPETLVPETVGAPHRIVFEPARLDVVEIGSTIARYMRGEGEAALAHLRALSGARSPADVIRLQVGEVQRAADASLTCWVTVVGQASRVVASR